MLSEHEKRNVSHTLSRIVVHEVIHAVAPELPHAEKGLTSPTLSRRFMLLGKAKIQSHWAAVFRQELSRIIESQACRPTSAAIRTEISKDS